MIVLRVLAGVLAALLILAILPPLALSWWFGVITGVLYGIGRRLVDFASGDRAEGDT
jgi:hypothetical protein